MQFTLKAFSNLNTDELYDLLKLRIDVFVVEQTCYYPDLDDLDRHSDSLHLFAYDANKPQTMQAYLRILPAGTTYEDYPSIGRVIVAESERGTGLGHELIKRGIKACEDKFPAQAIKISAQQHLAKFYKQHGFEQVTDMYLEDGIPHIGMIRSQASEIPKSS